MGVPLVSVVMAAHNVEAYVEEAVRSVLAQSDVSLELIVVDDASSDGTAARVAAIADSRLTLLTLRENAGVSAARNLALDHAQGQWIAIVDADDWIAPERLARLVEEADRLGTDWIADDQYFVRDGEHHPCARLMAGEPPGARLVSATHILAKDPPDHMGYGLLKPVFRRDLLSRTGLRYRPALRRYEDFLLLMELAAKGARLALLHEPLYRYRMRAGSLTKLDPRLVMDAMLEVSALARQSAAQAGDDALLTALVTREAKIRHGRRYYAFAMLLKSGETVQALLRLICDPGILPHVAGKLWARIVARLKHRDPLSHVLLGGTAALIPPKAD